MLYLHKDYTAVKMYKLNYTQPNFGNTILTKKVNPRKLNMIQCSSRSKEIAELNNMLFRRTCKCDRIIHFKKQRIHNRLVITSEMGVKHDMQSVSNDLILGFTDIDYIMMLFPFHIVSYINSLNIANTTYLLKREIKERKILSHTEERASAKILEQQVATISWSKWEIEGKLLRPGEVGSGGGGSWASTKNQYQPYFS